VSGTPLPPVPSNTVTTSAAQFAALSIVKSSTTTPAVGVGQVVPFAFVIVNTGNVTMSNVVVTDPKVGSVSCPQTTLAAGATMTCIASYTVTPADVTAGRVVNTASVVGAPTGGTPLAAVRSNQVLIPIFLAIIRSLAQRNSARRMSPGTRELEGPMTNRPSRCLQ
jgi:hypothetical protein